MENNKYINSFKTWQKFQQNKKWLLTYLVFILIVWIIVSIIAIFEKDLESLIASGFVSIVFIWISFFLGSSLVKPKNLNMKEVVIFLAFKVSNELSNGDTIMASIGINQLLVALNQKINTDRIKFVDETFPIKGFLSVNPDRINKKSIYKYMQLKNNSSQMIEELNKLANDYDNVKETQYLVSHKFLVFLNNNVEDLALPSKIDYLIKISPLLSLFSPFQLIK